MAVELNEQVFFVIVFVKRHGGGGLGRIAMAFHLGQNDFGDKGQIKFAHLIQVVSSLDGTAHHRRRKNHPDRWQWHLRQS